jgi:small nuclear ribonucleoprotein (snRNP)-like protein
MSIAQRRFNSEVSALIDRTIIVVTVDNKTYNGTLVGINPENLSLVLSDTKDPKGQMIPKVVLSGRTVARILSAEETFDLKGLAERLERVFPRMVKLYDNDGFIWVMDRVKVTEEGVVEGSGPAAERVATVYSQFVRDIRTE